MDYNFSLSLYFNVMGITEIDLCVTAENIVGYYTSSRKLRNEAMRDLFITGLSLKEINEFN